jgi:hypothetical protein
VDSTGGKSGEIKNYCHVYRPLKQLEAPDIQELSELLDGRGSSYTDLSSDFDNAS